MDLPRRRLTLQDLLAAVVAFSIAFAAIAAFRRWEEERAVTNGAIIVALGMLVPAALIAGVISLISGWRRGLTIGGVFWLVVYGMLMIAAVTDLISGRHE